MGPKAAYDRALLLQQIEYPHGLAEQKTWEGFPVGQALPVYRLEVGGV